MAPAPYDNFGLPYRNHFQSEVKPIPAGEPVELVFDLLPTAYRFGAGKQLRITVAFADADNFDTPVINPAPTLHLLRSAEHPSYVEIPLAQ
jgi:predicted acyl esterase